MGVCNKKIIMGKHKKTYCSIKCKKYAYRKRANDKNKGDWEWYFKGIINGREDRKNITPEFLKTLLEKQDHRCALSGVKMTCTKVIGDSKTIWTNASIDRIIPEKGYNVENVQLVCRAVNSFRNNMEVNDFINWCNRVTYHALQKQTKTLQKRISTTKI